VFKAVSKSNGSQGKEVAIKMVKMIDSDQQAGNAEIETYEACSQRGRNTLAIAESFNTRTLQLL
jgi:hypothetical protein